MNSYFNKHKAYLRDVEKLAPKISLHLISTLFTALFVSFIMATSFNPRYWQGAIRREL